MRILLLVKQVFANPASLKIIDNSIELEHSPKQTSSLDLVAIEQAVGLKEQGIASAVSVCAVGDKAVQKSLQTALAMGAQEAYHIEADLAALEPFGYASLINGFMAQHTFDCVLTGREDFDGGAGCCASMLAGLLGWPCADFITSMDYNENQGLMRLDCETEDGLESVTVQLPAVLSVDSGLNQPRFVKFPDLMKARKKELGHIEPASLKTDYTPQFNIITMEKIVQNRKQIKLSSVDALAQLLSGKSL